MAVGSRAVRVLLWGAVWMALWPLPTLAQQRVIQDVYLPAPISLFDTAVYDGPHGAQLAGILPRYIERPMDDLTPRPGALAFGMGGAQVALADGAMALGWNPAALSRLDRRCLYIDGLVRSSSGSGTHLPDSVLVPGFGYFQPRLYNASLTRGRAFDFFGVASPLLRLGSRPLVGGVAYRRHTDVAFGEATVLEMGLFSTGTAFPFVLGVDNQERGSIQSLTLGVGYEALRLAGFSLSLGATGNFLTGRLRSEVQLRAAVRNFEEGFVQFRRDYKGFVVEGGCLATAMDDRVRLGGWIGLPHKVNAYNSRFQAMPLVLPDELLVDRVHGTVVDYDLEVPLFASAGVALGPFRGVQVAADVNYRPWSDMEVKHRDPAYQQFDRDAIAADVTSYHVGGRFEFPFLRRQIHHIGMRLNTQLGYRTLPLSMRERDLLNGQLPHYLGDQVEGSATSFGFSLQTGSEITFHVGVEFQSYAFNTWFLDDQRPMQDRELGFRDPYRQVTRIDQHNTLLRFSGEMHL